MTSINTRDLSSIDLTITPHLGIEDLIVDKNIEKVVTLCKQYNITPEYNNNLHGDATGIGDILFHILCIKNKLITEPFIINLSYFTRPYYRSEPIKQLEFRLQLITDLIKYNTIDSNMIKFIFSSNNYINQSLPYKSINNFKLLLNDKSELKTSEQYIIFHTKCRHYASENYALIKEELKTFCMTFKSKYKIILMGERSFPNTEETEMHGITTVYNELLELNTCNDISDITIENIYNNLDYNNYKHDIALIKQATYNICPGLGGQLCSSLVFCNSVIFYAKNDYDIFNDTHYNNNNHYRSSNFTQFLNMIYEKCS